MDADLLDRLRRESYRRELDRVALSLVGFVIDPKHEMPLDDVAAWTRIVARMSRKVTDAPSGDRCA